MNRDLAKRYKEQRDALRRRFEAEKTGEQTLFIDQTKLFKPLIEVQKETSKAIEDKLAVSQDVLIPFTRELQKRNEQLEALQNLPYQSGIDVPPKDRDIINVDLDVGMDKTHSKNLYDMDLDLPSEVQRKNKIAETLKLIKKYNRRLGQLISNQSPAGKNVSPEDKEIYKSRKETLKIYRESIKALQVTEIFTEKSGQGLRRRKLCKPNRGRGRPRKYPDTILYNNPNELCEKLNELIMAKEAGNTGLDNSINSILDELLKIKSINKDDYDNLFKNIFGLI